jgi:hypothetical protein
MFPLGALYVSSVLPSGFMALNKSAAVAPVGLPTNGNTTAKQESTKNFCTARIGFP